MSAYRVGDRVRKRGLGHLGRITRVGINPAWIHVRWDEGYATYVRPQICHVKELEHVSRSAA